MKKNFLALILLSSSVLFAASDAENVNLAQENFSKIEARKHHKHHHSAPGADLPYQGSQARNTQVYGYFFTKDGATIESDNAIPLTLGYRSSLININDDGIVTIAQPGDYLVTFGAALINSESTNQIALRLQDTNSISIISNSHLSIPTSEQHTSLSVIVHITEESSLLSIINKSQDDITLGFTAPGIDSVNASLTIVRLHSLPTP